MLDVPDHVIPSSVNSTIRLRSYDLSQLWIHDETCKNDAKPILVPLDVKGDIGVESYHTFYSHDIVFAQNPVEATGPPSCSEFKKGDNENDKECRSTSQSGDS